MLSLGNSSISACELNFSCTFSLWSTRSDGRACNVWWRKRPYWGRVNLRYERFRTSVIITCAAGNSEEPAESSSKFSLDWDPFEDLFGLGVDLRSRKDTPTQQMSQKYDLDGVSRKEIPCPTCKGRGYLLCRHCTFTNLESSCSHCSGKGYHDCPLCHGECVIWEDTLSASTWASLHSRSPLQIAEDDAIESIANSLAPKRKTRRVYGSPPPETRKKISRALKDWEARTGSISRRLKNLHQDPVLRAQRTAAIKKARGTDEARKLTSEKLKEYFKSPENRLKRSQSMIGVRFTCRACGEEGHRRHFCPQLGFKSKTTRPIRSNHCSYCGQIGHQRRHCPEKGKLDSSSPGTITELNEKNAEQERWCGVCRSFGHAERTCPKSLTAKRFCSICGQPGHNRRTCSAAVK